MNGTTFEENSQHSPSSIGVTKTSNKPKCITRKSASLQESESSKKSGNPSNKASERPTIAPSSSPKQEEAKNQKSNQTLNKESGLNIKSTSAQKESSKPNLPKLWLDRGSKSYKVWAKKSEKGNGYVFCSFCKDDILVASCYGDHCHQATKKHLDQEKEWRKVNPEVEIKKEAKDAEETKFGIEKAISIFEYKLVQFISF